MKVRDRCTVAIPLLCELPFRHREGKGKMITWVRRMKEKKNDAVGGGRKRREEKRREERAN